MLKTRTALICLLTLPMITQPCRAWSECGHHIIAILAFDQIQPAQQKRILRLLAQHPRFAEDFSPPVVGMTSEQLSRWYVGCAGYWPDVARGFPEYDRPTWHYQLGSTLTIGDQVNVPLAPGRLPAEATLETRELYIAQAIELCRKTLRDKTTTEAEKAVAICWLCHLVADAHQPCHAGSLYVETVFPDGDRGANGIETTLGRNLHGLWDDLLGQRYDAAEIARRAENIAGEVLQIGQAKTAANSVDDLNPANWLAESVTLGRQSVYTPDVMNAIEAARRSGTDQVELLDLPETYLKHAQLIAEQQAAVAATRLAAVFNEALAQ